MRNVKLANMRNSNANMRNSNLYYTIFATLVAHIFLQSRTSSFYMIFSRAHLPSIYFFVLVYIYMNTYITKSKRVDGRGDVLIYVHAT